MAKAYSRTDLYNFVWRADTHEKIEVAKKWITAHVRDDELWNDLMTQLSIQSRNLYRAESGRQLI